MQTHELIFFGWIVLAVIALVLVEMMDTIKKAIGLKQEQLKAPPLQPHRPVVIVQPEEEPRVLLPKEGANGTPALTPRRGGGDGQGHP